jgi:hypothetical protein
MTSWQSDHNCSVFKIEVEDAQQGKLDGSWRGAGSPTLVLERFSSSASRPERQAAEIVAETFCGAPLKIVDRWLSQLDG